MKLKALEPKLATKQSEYFSLTEQSIPSMKMLSKNSKILTSDDPAFGSINDIKEFNHESSKSTALHNKITKTRNPMSMQNIRKESQTEILKKLKEFRDKSFAKILEKTDKSGIKIIKKEFSQDIAGADRKKSFVRSKSINTAEMEALVYENRFPNKSKMNEMSLHTQSQVLKPFTQEQPSVADARILGYTRNQFSVTGNKFFSHNVMTNQSNPPLFSSNTPSMSLQRSSVLDKMPNRPKTDVKPKRSLFTESTDFKQLSDLHHATMNSLFKTGVFEYQKHTAKRQKANGSNAGELLSETKGVEHHIRSLCLDNSISFHPSSIGKTGKASKPTAKLEYSLKPHFGHDRSQQLEGGLRTSINSSLANSDIQKILLDNQRIYNKAKMISKY
jgi:hypothetical protein